MVNETIKKIAKTIIEILKTVLGHAVSGAVVGAIFEVEQLIISGVPVSIGTGLVAIGIGGSLGFFKSIVDEIGRYKKSTAGAVQNKSARAYLGI